jgi:hypothetical protein
MLYQQVEITCCTETVIFTCYHCFCLLCSSLWWCFFVFVIVIDVVVFSSSLYGCKKACRSSGICCQTCWNVCLTPFGSCALCDIGLFARVTYCSCCGWCLLWLSLSLCSLAFLLCLSWLTQLSWLNGGTSVCCSCLPLGVSGFVEKTFGDSWKNIWWVTKRILYHVVQIVQN